MTSNTIVEAYILSAVVGGLIAGGWVHILVGILHWQIGPDPTSSTERIWWIPVLIGIAERMIVTTLVIWSPKLLAGFIAGWMALKVAGGWGLLRESTARNRSTRAIALLGSVVSLAWAIGIGLYFAPESLAAFSSSTSN